MKIKIKNILLFLGMLSLTRCANVVTPTGGPKDTTPPKVTEARPADRSTGFVGRKIEFTFDEYIVLDNASQNVLFSPPLTTKPDIKLSNKTVVIRLKEDLQPNTTYTIQFGSAVKDLHEGNLLKDYRYTFSTGDVLDTLTIKGKVLNADDKKPAEDLFVELYSSEHDSLFGLPTRRVPDFITKTDKEGKFELSGLPDKQFLVFALKDMNSNSVYDMPNETVAFIDTLVSSNSTIELYAFIEKDTSQLLLEKKLIEEGLLRFVFRQPADEVSIGTPDRLMDSFRMAEVWSPTHDTLWWYFTPNVMDSLRVNIQYDTVINDSTRYSLRYRETAKAGRREKKKVVTVTNNLKNNMLMPDDTLKLLFSEPILGDSIRYEETLLVKDDAYGMAFRLIDRPSDSAQFTLNLPDSLCYSVRGRTHDSISIKYRHAQAADLGNIYIQVAPPQGTQAVIQLVNSKGNVLESQLIKDEQRVAFLQLLPDKYKLRAILDIDGDGKWSSGNFHRRYLPETVLEYKDPLEVKAGWDIDLEEKWILFSK